jgi:hypothetical protein
VECLEAAGLKLMDVRRRPKPTIPELPPFFMVVTVRLYIAAAGRPPMKRKNGWPFNLPSCPFFTSRSRRATAHHSALNRMWKRPIATTS